MVGWVGVDWWSVVVVVVGRSCRLLCGGVFYAVITRSCNRAPSEGRHLVCKC
jgi:hypothetical protein